MPFKKIKIAFLVQIPCTTKQHIDLRAPGMDVQMLLCMIKPLCLLYKVSKTYVSCGHLIIDYVRTAYVRHEAEQLKSSKCIEPAYLRKHKQRLWLMKRGWCILRSKCVVICILCRCFCICV